MDQQKRDELQLCVNCGVSTAFGSGHFVNRIPVCNSEQENKDCGWDYPEGTYLCGLCDRKITALSLSAICLECEEQAERIPDDPRDVTETDLIKRHFKCRNGHEWSITYEPTDYEVIKGAEDNG